MRKKITWKSLRQPGKPSKFAATFGDGRGTGLYRSSLEFQTNTRNPRWDGRLWGASLTRNGYIKELVDQGWAVRHLSFGFGLREFQITYKRNDEKER